MKNINEITINGKQLSDILADHEKWLLEEEGGICADLSRADLGGANLSGANLCRADLCGADLGGADLSRADLGGANLSGANLRRADLCGANLSGANLCRADLCNADLGGANLRNAKNAEMAAAITSIVPEGDIIGWKKCNEGIAKLLIPANAKRSNATGRKCRCEFAIDQAHFNFDGTPTDEKFTSRRNDEFIYRVGETIIPDKWDDNRLNECSNGIHFFITHEEAEAYDD